MTYEIGNGIRAKLVVGGEEIPVGVNEVAGRLFLSLRATFRPAFRVGDTIHLTGLGAGMTRAASGDPPAEADFLVVDETGSPIRGMRQFRLVAKPTD